MGRPCVGMAARKFVISSALLGKGTAGGQNPGELFVKPCNWGGPRAARLFLLAARLRLWKVVEQCLLSLQWLHLIRTKAICRHMSAVRMCD